jgi:hypothetical protein
MVCKLEVLCLWGGWKFCKFRGNLEHWGYLGHYEWTDWRVCSENTYHISSQNDINECVSVLIDGTSLRSPLRRLAKWTLEYNCDNDVYVQCHTGILLWYRAERVCADALDFPKLTPYLILLKANEWYCYSLPCGSFWILYPFYVRTCRIDLSLSVCSQPLTRSPVTLIATFAHQ